MMKTTPILIIVLAELLSSCSVTHAPFSPTQKFAPEILKQDYNVYRKVLELHHPSLYWYTDKESMDRYFDEGRKQLRDSMTEPEFRKLLNYVTAKIDCGHTTTRPSRKWNKYLDTVRVGKLFPLSVKVWDSALVVTVNLNRRDTILKRGTVIERINGHCWKNIVDTMFEYVSTDGYNTTNKYQSLSNRGFFGTLYTSLYGISDKYEIEYRHLSGKLSTVTVPVYNAALDTINQMPRPSRNEPKPSRKDRKTQQLDFIRLLKVDTVNRTAMMDLATFGRGYGLRKFFKNSFHALKANNISHLIIDVRSNGGGSVSNSTNITRYISDHKFKVADSLYAERRSSRYGKYIADNFWNRLFIFFFTKKKSDGKYHFGYFERHYFKPRKKDHFDGKVYILTGGNSFSATALFASALVKQENVFTVGEETGGGAYGNSAWLIPDVTLPHTGVRFRLPLFRLVIENDIRLKGRGIQPEIAALPSVEAIRRNLDFKVEKAMELIRQDKEKR